MQNLTHNCNTRVAPFSGDPILVAFIYDIPRDEGITSHYIEQLIRDLSSFPCEVQILPGDTSKSVTTGRAKFECEAHLYQVLTMHEFIHLPKGKRLRLKSYDPNHQSDGKTAGAKDLTLFDPNCNVFLKRINREWTKGDLEEIFAEYGTIVSTKFLVSAITGQPNGMGYILFANP